MQYLYLNNVKTASGVLSIYFTFIYAYTYNGTYYGYLRKISDYKIGSDNDNENILAPNEINLDFYFNVAGVSNLQILDDFRNIKCQVSITLAGSYIFYGYVDKNSIRYDDKEKTFSLKLLELTSQVMQAKPADNPLGYQTLPLGEVSTSKKLFDIIKEPFNSVLTDYTYFYTDLISMSTLEGRISSTIFSVSDFRLQNYILVNSAFDNYATLLKHIARNINTILMPFPDRKLYLITKYIEYYTTSINYFLKKDLIDYEFDVIPKMNGIKGTTIEQTPVTTTYGNTDLNKSYTEEFRYWNSFAVDYTGVLTQLTDYRIRFNGGSYSTWNANLTGFLVTDVWDRINKSRKKATIKVSGNWNNWKPNNYYALEGDNALYRATAFEFDIINKNTKIYLRQIW